MSENRAGRTKKYRRSGRIAHQKRPFVAGRPVHVIHKVREGVPSLRQGWVRERVDELLVGVRARGLRVVCWVVMADHVHLVCVAARRSQLTDALRWLFGQLARALKAAFDLGRGRVFVDRFFSVTAQSARQAWHTIGYVLRNPGTAGLCDGPGLDPWLGFDRTAVDSDAFLLSVLGPRSARRTSLLLRMTRVFVPWTRRPPRPDRPEAIHVQGELWTQTRGPSTGLAPPGCGSR